MNRKLAYLGCIALILGAGGIVRAAAFTDTFDVSRDYLVDGVAGTGWDGFLGSDPGETVDALNASQDRAGQLFMQSTGSYWEGAFSPRGPFLYKLVEGDFIATVEVTDFPGMAGSVSPRTEHADAFLMARVANLDDAGAGEDFVCIHYFPTWVGNMRRQMDNGTETEGPNTGDGFNCARFLQLERVGNDFTFRRSFDGITWTTVGASVTRNDMDGLAVQVGLANSMYNSTTGYVAWDNFAVSGSSVVPPNKAYNSEPANGATDVPSEALLSWTPAEAAVAHDLYFGTDLSDVMAADSTTPLGVLAAAGYDANSYDVGLLAFGQTYFWRVDEVTESGVNRGEVWSFTVEPYAYPIAGVTATASSLNSKDTGPEKTVDGSGLDADGRHLVDTKTMWLSSKTGAQPTWIQYEFDRVYKMDHVLVWNSNQMLEPILGLGAKDVSVEYSTDGSTWASLGDVELAQAVGEPLSPEAVDLGGVMAKYVKLTIASNWGGLLKQYGLSEVRFYYVPVLAREPNPASGATGVNPQTTLSWRAGREAVSHQVSLSTEEQAVITGTAPVATVSEPLYGASLDLGRSYFWKVAEVNDAAVPATWEGEVWTFSTADYLVVDDFESYIDDEGGRIYQFWIDGLTDGKSGSQVGYDASPFAETAIVHAGKQSMPLTYGNATFAFSEATRTFASAQDWTRHGVTTLVVSFHGVITNTSSPLYVKINDTKVLYNAGVAATALPLWKQWNIDLASTGANLKSVRSLTIGVGNGASGGTGTIFIDDIRLYREAPSVVAPVDPGNGGIVANYAFDGTVQDSSGRNNHGQITGDAGYEDAPGYGQALIFNGINAYVDLPIGSVINSLSDMTIAAYVNFAGLTGDWQRIFDFGTGTTSYMFLSPRIGATGPMRFAITTGGGGAEQQLTAPMTLPEGWRQVVVVIDGTTMTIRLHLDGAVVASGATSLLPKDLGNTTQNYLGRSQYEGDALFTGSVGDLRIYSRALSEAEVRYLAGDR